MFYFYYPCNWKINYRTYDELIKICVELHLYNTSEKKFIYHFEEGALF